MILDLSGDWDYWDTSFNEWDSDWSMECECSNGGGGGTVAPGAEEQVKLKSTGSGGHPKLPSSDRVDFLL